VQQGGSSPRRRRGTWTVEGHSEVVLSQRRATDAASFAWNSFPVLLAQVVWRWLCPCSFSCLLMPNPVHVARNLNRLRDANTVSKYPGAGCE
jgi:hypothetical protein